MLAGIFTNIHKDKDLSVTKQVIKLLKECGTDFFVYEEIKNEILFEKYFSENSDIKFDIMITVGGDGTILRIAKYCAKFNTPIIGINLGKLGFLAQLELKDIDILRQILSEKEPETEKRTMIEIKLNNKSYYALNEVVISRSNEERMISIGVSINKNFVDNYYCDGYIVSTPTGSTAYSLSAGGSILSPNAENFSLTPINSHSLHSRPIVIPDKDSVTITLSKSSAAAGIIMDGKKIGEIECGASVTITKSKLYASFIKLSGDNFYSKLLYKLNSWSTTEEVK